MQDAFSRVELLVGDNGIKKLSRARIAVFGLGGAGSYAAEALARCGVGSLTLVDYGRISMSNIGNQLPAFHSTIGQSKVQMVKNRVHDIDENILVHTYETFYNEESSDMFDLKSYDYIIDAMDTLASKLILIKKAKEEHIPIIYCMDLGNKIDPSRIEIADIGRVSSCPVARVVRAELRRKGIRRLKVLYSREKSIGRRFMRRNRQAEPGQTIEGSVAFITGAAGSFLAGEVVRDILFGNINNK